jgi:hypothetical protein
LVADTKIFILEHLLKPGIDFHFSRLLSHGHKSRVALHLLESRVGDHIRAVYGFGGVERRGWIFSHLAALFVVFPGGHGVVFQPPRRKNNKNNAMSVKTKKNSNDY